MKDENNQIWWQKRIVADPAGVFFIILSGLLGWLPGPGGMPLLYAGLRMLAYNNKWADDLLSYLKKEGLDILDRLFPDRKFIMLLWDAFVIAAVSLGVFILSGYDSKLYIAIATALIIWAIVAFLTNRRRFTRAKKRLYK